MSTDHSFEQSSILQWQTQAKQTAAWPSPAQSDSNPALSVPWVPFSSPPTGSVGYHGCNNLQSPNCWETGATRGFVLTCWQIMINRTWLANQHVQMRLHFWPLIFQNYVLSVTDEQITWLDRMVCGKQVSSWTLMSCLGSPQDESYTQNSLPLSQNHKPKAGPQLRT